MVYVEVSEPSRLTSFYLAMEEYIARHVDSTEDCFFMWQVPPTVMFGRNQLIDNEVNTEYCQEKGIHLIRRKSGGGCIYVDEGCILFSCITHDDQVNMVFCQYIKRVVDMLQAMGVDAHSGGRNDILIGDKKVSGNAFYHVPGRSIVHGTMLYDTNIQNMVASITPSQEKLISKGVQSIRQHIALLKDHTTLTLEEVKRFARQHLCSSTITLTADDVKGIEEIEQDYLSDDFTYGNNPRYSIVHKKRFEGVGELEVRLELKNNVIKEANIMGDYFLTGDLDNGILKKLRHVPYNVQAIDNALPDRLDDIIRNLKKQQLVDLILAE